MTIHSEANDDFAVFDKCMRGILVKGKGMV